MNSAIIVAVIAAAASALTFYLTKRYELFLKWRDEKINHYRTLFNAISALAVDGMDKVTANQEFSLAANTIYLVAPQYVISALMTFHNEAKGSNPNSTIERHDKLLNELILAIRKDIGLNKGDKPEEFNIHLIGSVPDNILSLTPANESEKEEKNKETISDFQRSSIKGLDKSLKDSFKKATLDTKLLRVLEKAAIDKFLDKNNFSAYKANLTLEMKLLRAHNEYPSPTYFDGFISTQESNIFFEVKFNRGVIGNIINIIGKQLSAVKTYSRQKAGKCRLVLLLVNIPDYNFSIHINEMLQKHFVQEIKDGLLEISEIGFTEEEINKLMETLAVST